LGPPGPRAAQPTQRRFDPRDLSYATTFDSRWRAGLIWATEWVTGKRRLLQAVRRFEAAGVPEGHAFWRAALGIMGIRVEVPRAELTRIPQEGPLIVVANHPHGLVDGMVLAALVAPVRRDYRILTRSLLTRVEPVAEQLIPVPFPHEPRARELNLEMRRAALGHLEDGGALLLFPAGQVAAAETPMGPPVEGDWHSFTAQLIRRSRAQVLPVRFPGSNSRAYQIANCLSPTLRQGLLIHEVVRAMNRPQRPRIGRPLTQPELARWEGRPRVLMRWLRGHVLSLD
jgi:putative hemolysin